MIAEQDTATLWDKIKDIEVGMLVTHDGEITHSRPMHNVQKDFDGTLWFFAAKDDAKIAEIRKNPNVNVTYADPHQNTYVSISGRAMLETDRNKIDQLWNPAISTYVAKDKGDPDLCLLCIEMEAAEYWDPSSARMTGIPP